MAPGLDIVCPRGCFAPAEPTGDFVLAPIDDEVPGGAVVLAAFDDDVLGGVVVGLSRVDALPGDAVGGFTRGPGAGTIGRTTGGTLGEALRDELCDPGVDGGCAPIAAVRDELCDRGGGAVVLEELCEFGGTAVRDELCDELCASGGGGAVVLDELCEPGGTAVREELCEPGGGGGAVIGLLRGPPIGDCGDPYGDDDEPPIGDCGDPYGADDDPPTGDCGPPYGDEDDPPIGDCGTPYGAGPSHGCGAGVCVGGALQSNSCAGGAGATSDCTRGDALPVRRSIWSCGIGVGARVGKCGTTGAGATPALFGSYSGRSCGAALNSDALSRGAGSALVCAIIWRMSGCAGGKSGAFDGLSRSGSGSIPRVIADATSDEMIAPPNMKRP